MRILLLGAILFCSGWAFASKNLHDVPYNFDQERIDAAENSYKFMTAFAEYYYELVQANVQELETVRELGGVAAWCAGDAHPENFGALILSNRQSEFTINDMDDSGPCPAAMDFLRFLVTAHLAESKVKTKDLVDAYTAGLLKQRFSRPKTVENLLRSSRRHGFAIHPDDLDWTGQRLERDAQSQEISDAKFVEIASVINARFPQIEMIDAFSTRKLGGGSNGIPRFELLFATSDGPLHLELKGQGDPAIASVAPSPVPSPAARLTKTIQLEIGPQAPPYYEMLTIGGMPMLLRPRYRGNEPVKLKNLNGDEDIITYEAYILGGFHALTLGDVKAWASSVKKKDWSGDVRALKEHFEKKFSELKNQKNF